MCRHCQRLKTLRKRKMAHPASTYGAADEKGHEVGSLKKAPLIAGRTRAHEGVEKEGQAPRVPRGRLLAVWAGRGRRGELRFGELEGQELDPVMILERDRLGAPGRHHFTPDSERVGQRKRSMNTTV